MNQINNVNISIIFPTYNAKEYLNLNLDSIQKLSLLEEIEIIIIDNNSTDNTKEIIKSYEKLNIILIESKKNLGFAKACNIGAKKANGQYIFITNQDVIFPEKFFDNILTVYNKLKEKYKDIILCPALVFSNNKINYFGAKIHYLGFSYTPEMYNKIPKKKASLETYKASGASMFLEKESFMSLKGFDSHFFMYHEDTDFSLKAKRKNIKILTTNKSYLIHQKNEFKLDDFSYYFLERNRHFCYIKNLKNLKELIPYILIIEFALFFQAILIKKIKNRIQIYKFFLQNYKNIKEMRTNEFNSSFPKLKKSDLSQKLDNILLGKSYKNKKLFHFVIKFLNLIL